MRWLYKVLVASIFFFAPLGQAVIYYLGVPYAPHLILTALAFGLGLILARRIIKPHFSLVVYAALVAYLFFVTASVAYIPGYADTGLGETIRRLLLIGPVLLASFVVFRSAGTAEIDLYIKAFVLGVGISVLIAFYLFYQGEVFWKARLSYSPEYNPAIFGAYVASALIFVLGLPSKVSSSKVVIIVAGVVFVLALIMSQARNSMIALSLGGLIAIFMVWRKWLPSSRKILSAMVVVGIMVGVVALAIYRGLIPDEYYSRLLVTLTMDDAHAGTAGRTTIWSSYLDWGISAFGYGIDSDAYAVLSRGQWIGISTHNSYLDVLVSGGVLGLAMLILFHGTVLYRAIKAVGDKRFVMVWLAWFWIFIPVGNDTFANAVFWIPFALWAFLEMVDRNERRVLKLGSN